MDGLVPECPISYSGPGRVVGLVWFLLLLELPAREMPEKRFCLESVAVRTFGTWSQVLVSVPANPRTFCTQESPDKTVSPGFSCTQKLRPEKVGFISAFFSSPKNSVTGLTKKSLVGVF
jgi:hypothetical protein